MVIVFLGTKIFPEYETSNNVLFGEVLGIDSEGKKYGYVTSGLEKDYKDKGFLTLYGPSRHLTMVFNTFVWL